MTPLINWIGSTVGAGGSASEFDPMSLNPVFGLSSTASFVSTIDNNTDGRGSLVDSITANTGQAITTGGTFITNPRFNGEGFNVPELGYMRTGLVSDYEFLHDGSDFNIYWNMTPVKPLYGGDRKAILFTHNFSTTEKGIMMYWNSGGDNKVWIWIGNGTASVVSLGTGALDIFNFDELVSFRLKKVGNNLTLYKIVEGAESSVAASSGTTWATGNHVVPMALFGKGSANNASVCNDLWIFDRILSDDEALLMANRNELAVANPILNVHLIIGDSLATGQGANANIESGLELIQDCLVLNHEPQTESRYIDRLLLAENHNPAAYITIHGLEMKLGNLLGVNNVIVKYGAPGVSTQNFASPGSQHAVVMKMCNQIASEMQHSKNYKINVDSITIFLGANDCGVGEGANVQADITSMVKDIINEFLGNDNVTVNAKIFIPVLKEGPSYDATAYAIVKGAQENIGNGSISVDEPTVAAYIRGSYDFSTDSYPDIGDGVHIDEDGYVTMANEINNNM